MADLLLQDLENPIEINVEDATEISWGKSLRHRPLFTIKEIQMHRQESGKDHGGPILKIVDRGRKVKDERDISADSVFAAVNGNSFFYKRNMQSMYEKRSSFYCNIVE